MFDLRARCGKVQRLGMAGTNGTKFPGIREHLQRNIQQATNDSAAAPPTLGMRLTEPSSESSPARAQAYVHAFNRRRTHVHSARPTHSRAPRTLPTTRSIPTRTLQHCECASAALRAWLGSPVGPVQRRLARSTAMAQGQTALCMHAAH